MTPGRERSACHGIGGALCSGETKLKVRVYKSMQLETTYVAAMVNYKSFGKKLDLLDEKGGRFEIETTPPYRTGDLNRPRPVRQEKEKEK